MKVTPENKQAVEALKKQYLAANHDFAGWDVLLSKAQGMPDLDKAVKASLPADAGPTIPFGDAPIDGGMAETDAATLAEHYLWVVATSKEWSCSKDRSHTPKGRVYTDGRDNYWGADNTGHVGFCFKYWTGSPRDLTYRGNVPHCQPFAVVQRGAQRAKK